MELVGYGADVRAYSSATAAARQAHRLARMCVGKTKRVCALAHVRIIRVID